MLVSDITTLIPYPSMPLVAAKFQKNSKAQDCDTLPSSPSEIPQVHSVE